MKLVKTDQRVLDHLLEKYKFDLKTKSKEIKKDKKYQGKPSTYKHKLRPINGKDVTTIEK